MTVLPKFFYYKVHVVGPTKIELEDCSYADVVEVVRCRNCIHGEVDDPDFPNQYFCNYSGEDWNPGEHFCSHGRWKKVPKWLYRLESIFPDNGLWYNADNEMVWGIGKLPNCKAKDLPMDYDPRYHKDGRNWHSSCSRREDLLHWYSLQDANDLIANGFVFTRYMATEYEEYDLETCFIKETCLKREIIDIEDLFKEAPQCSE